MLWVRADALRHHCRILPPPVSAAPVGWQHEGHRSTTPAAATEAVGAAAQPHAQAAAAARRPARPCCCRPVQTSGRRTCCRKGCSSRQVGHRLLCCHSRAAWPGGEQRLGSRARGRPDDFASAGCCSGPQQLLGWAALLHPVLCTRAFACHSPVRCPAIPCRSLGLGEGQRALPLCHHPARRCGEPSSARMHGQQVVRRAAAAAAAALERRCRLHAWAKSRAGQGCQCNRTLCAPR